MTAYDWDAAWSPTTIASAVVATASAATTGAISNDGKLGTEVAVAVTYGLTASEGVKVYVLRNVNGSYEAVADLPWGFEMPNTVSTTHRRTFTVPGSISDFKVHLTNDAGASVTATVSTRQAVV